LTSPPRWIGESKTPPRKRHTEKLKQVDNTVCATKIPMNARHRGAKAPMPLHVRGSRPNPFDFNQKKNPRVLRRKHGKIVLFLECGNSEKKSAHGVQISTTVETERVLDANTVIHIGIYIHICATYVYVYTYIHILRGSKGLSPNPKPLATMRPGGRV